MTHKEENLFKSILAARYNHKFTHLHFNGTQTITGRTYTPQMVCDLSKTMLRFLKNSWIKLILIFVSLPSFVSLLFLNDPQMELCCLCSLLLLGIPRIPTFLQRGKKPHFLLDPHGFLSLLLSRILENSPALVLPSP